MAQILDQIVQFRPGEKIICLHRVAADGLGDGVLAEPREIHLAPGGFQFIHQIQDKFPRVAGFDKRRQRVEQERPLAKFAQADAEFGQHRQLGAQKIRVARRKLDGFRQQQFLRRRKFILLEAIEHLLEQNPFVRGVLVEQHQTAVGFEDDVKLADDADQPQRDIEQRSG